MASGNLSDEQHLRANQSNELKEAQYRKCLIATASDPAIASLSRDES
jgi:hypothetical protein